MSKSTQFLKQHKEIIALWFVQTIIFLFVFGKKIIKLNSVFFADSYDASKNYFTYYYYTLVQESNNGFFEGMNYPFGEYVFYTDNTPIIAYLAKLFGVGTYSIAFYNAIFLLLWFIVPFVSYKILRLLNVLPILAVIFSVIMCWTNPLLNHFGSTVNLSLFIFYLLALYFFLKHIKASKLSTQLYYTAAQFVLIYMASFFHLYYLPIVLLFLGGAYGIYFVATRKVNILWQSFCLAAFSAIAVYATIISIDQYYDIRPDGAGGYGYSLYRNNIQDFMSSFLYLDFPNRYHYSDWGQQKWTFLGSGYLLAFGLSILSLPLFFKKNIIEHQKIILSIVVGGVLCALVSMGDTIDMHEGKTLYTNYLNPFYHISKVTDFVTHFRYIRRFSAPFWMIYFVWLAVVSNAAYRKFDTRQALSDAKKMLLKIYSASLKILVIIFLVISSYDAVQYIQFHTLNYNKESLFTKKNLAVVPDFTNHNFAAILPIPYFYVGSEISQYVIDDPDDWSRALYKLSVKNKLPLMACKMCRIPDEFAKKAFSVFEKNTDLDMIKSFEGKKILLAVSKNNDWMNQDNPYVQQLKSQLEMIIDKHEAQLLKEDGGIEYYEMYLR